MTTTHSLARPIALFDLPNGRFDNITSAPLQPSAISSGAQYSEIADMNVENILKVADAIEQHSIPDLGFNMSGYIARRGVRDQSGHNCQTTACIAGYAAVLSGAVKPDEVDADAHEPGAAFLGLAGEAADSLFFARNHPQYRSRGSRLWERITAPEAIAVLRHLAATGEVDWSISSLPEGN